MKVFVAYSYHKPDEWIKELIFPLIEAFDGEAVDGKEIAGQNLADGVVGQIEAAQAFIGFRTKRDPSLQTGDDGGGSHEWVTQELAAARANKLLRVEVRELGVKPHAMSADMVHIEYDPQNREVCLAQLVPLLASWRSQMPVMVKLLPQTFVDAIRPLIGSQGYPCTYSYMDGAKVSKDQEGKIHRISGGLFMFVQGVPLDAPVVVTVVANGREWKSDFESIRFPSVNMM